MEMEFLFVTTTRGSIPQDPAIRTLIRKHVMKGHGQNRRPPIRKPQARPAKRSSATRRGWTEGAWPDDSTKHDTTKSSIEVANAQLCENPGGSPSSSYLLSKVSQYYGADFIDTGQYQSMWWDLSQLDPAAEYQVTALLASYVSSRHPIPSASKQEFQSSITIRNQAVQEINKRLSHPVLRSSDGVIAAIVASILQAHLYPNQTLYALHMKGLIAVVIQRPGGWESLNSNPRLQLLVSAADVYCACGDQRAPYLPIPVYFFTTEGLGPARTRSKTSLSISSAWRESLPHHERTIQIFDDIILFLSQLDPDRKMWIPMTVAPKVIGYLHMLCIERAKREGYNQDALLECVYIALFMALSESRRQICIVPGDRDLPATRLRELLQRSDVDWEGLKLMKLWILVSAVKEAKGRALETWFHDQMTKAVKSLPKSTQAEALRDIDAMFVSNVIIT